ncbi:hypothetical protein GLYMA_18G247900v4 [Glycine max]|nr:hypothetical protein GLYMA_18G247900v4 [Glycine max]KAH1156030.1 hypothetical protein GYH30_051030 [Glycine max]
MNEKMKREEKQFREEMFKFTCFIRGCHDASKLLQYKKYGDEEIGAKKGYAYLSFSDLYGSSIPRLYNWMTSPLSTSIGLPSVEQTAIMLREMIRSLEGIPEIVKLLNTTGKELFQNSHESYLL